MKKLLFVILFILLFSVMAISFVGCEHVQVNIDETPPASPSEYKVVYVSDSVKADWFAPLVKLISNQEKAIYESDNEPPRPEEPSITYGCNMGLFDVNLDGVPELLVNLGGGSAGNDYFYIYDIFSGKKLGELEGGGENAWAVYYDISSSQYMTVGRYDWRIGSEGSQHFVTTIVFDETEQCFIEKTLFYSSYEYRYSESGLEVMVVKFSVDGKSTDFQSYHYAITDFYTEYALVPNTALRQYSWRDVSDEDDGYQERAEKMAQKLLYDQEFVSIGN